MRRRPIRRLNPETSPVRPPDPRRPTPDERPNLRTTLRPAGHRDEAARPQLRRRHPGRRRHRPRRRTRRDLRLPRPERRRQVHDRAHALHPAGADRRARPPVAGYDVVAEPGRVRLRIGVALQEAALDPKQTGARAAATAGSALRLCQARSTDQRARRARRADRPRRRARPAASATYSRRHEASPRPRRRARAQPRGAVPRRAHHRARSGQPGHGVGGGAAAQRRARA